MKKTNLLKRSNVGILDMFRKDIFLSKPIMQIAALLRKPYPKVYSSMRELVAAGIIAINKVGMSNLCRLEMSQEAISILSFLDEQEALQRKIPNINKILSFKEFLDDIIIVTGSYAKGKQTKGSDIDIVVIMKGNPASKQRLLENLTSLMTPRMHVVAISYNDFIGMLAGKEDNYGKEIFKNRLIFRNAKRYYELIKEAIDNGFRG
ncbi:MAG: hypothetical protein FJY76_03220 [Candidatus Aenigmarchaeota archaeon]|nr:hypothetical protein [Candidatus Aenigmarchaeota archaeon]